MTARIQRRRTKGWLPDGPPLALRADDVAAALGISRALAYQWMAMAPCRSSASSASAAPSASPALPSRSGSGCGPNRRAAPRRMTAMSPGPRRGNREGSFRHRPDGRWEARVMLAGHQRSVYGRTRDEARDRLRRTTVRYLYTVLDIALDAGVKARRLHENPADLIAPPAKGSFEASLCRAPRPRNCSTASTATGMRP